VLAWVYAAAMVLNIALNAILIPRYSLDGPAFATSVCEALTGALMLAFALRVSGALDWRAIAVGPVVASALAGGTMAVLHGQVVAAMAASAIVYIGVLMLLERRFHPEDYERVMSFARRRPRGASAR
jgi:O-antigen/teichoic acid export membrane protein